MQKTVDLNRLIEIMKASTSDMLNNPQAYFKGKITKAKNYVYINNGASVLAVAHLDTVGDSGTLYTGFAGRGWSPVAMKYSDPSYKKMGISDYEITGMQLDDRLGVFIITEILPMFGVSVDVLLTTDEEKGMSTASEFISPKEYNWMFQFDRKGYGTVVMYQYHTDELKLQLTDMGYDVQRGTLSDISDLDFLGISGFNFGTGYVNEHTNACRTRLSWVSVCVEMFVQFYNKYHDTKMPYVKVEIEPAKPIGGRYPWKNYRWDMEDSNEKWRNGTDKTKPNLCCKCGTALKKGERGACDKCLGVFPTSDIVTKAKCSVCNLIYGLHELNDRLECPDCIAWLRRDSNYIYPQ